MCLAWQPDRPVWYANGFENFLHEGIIIIHVEEVEKAML